MRSILMMLKLKTMYDKEADWLTKKTTDEQKLANFEASVNKEISRKRQKTSESLEFVKSLLLALIRAKQAIADLKGANADQQAGISIVARAMEEPARCIAFNAGDPADVIVNEIASKSGNYGYNAATGEYGDMVEQGVIDPTKVTKTALVNAASIAGLILTTDCSIAQIPAKEGAQGQAGGMGMPGMM